MRTPKAVMASVQRNCDFMIETQIEDVAVDWGDMR